jgi:hypothetical protein
MCADDGPADRQSHPDAAGFCRVESVENVLATSGSMPGPESRTATRTPHLSLRSVLSNNSRTPSSTALIASTAFRTKFSTTLLQLNAITLDAKQALGQAGLHRDPILDDCASRQSNHLVDRLAEIKTITEAPF